MFKGTFLYLGGAGQVFIGALDWGSPMSNVDFKKWHVAFPVAYFSQCHMSNLRKNVTTLSGPMWLSLSPMSNLRNANVAL